MRVLQINVVYPGGSTGRIVDCIQQALVEDGNESVVCYGRGTNTSGKPAYKTSHELIAKFNNAVSRLSGLMYGGCFFSTKRLIKIIKREKPDIVHLHCLNGNFVNIYSLVDYLKRNDIPSVLTLHAEFMYTGNCSHAYECDKWKTGCGKCMDLTTQTRSLLFDRTHVSWEKMKRSFSGFNRIVVVSVSPWVLERAKQSPILRMCNHRVIMNGVNTSVFKPTNSDSLRTRYKLINKKVILYVTPEFNKDVSDNKGGYYIIELAKLLSDYPDYVIVVVGGRCDNDDLPPNIFHIGYVRDVNILAQWYSLAEYTVITSKRETFSMVLAESNCCGTPVIGFKSGGPESIAIDGFASFYDYGDINSVYNQIIHGSHRYIDTEKAKMTYSNNRMCNEYLDTYNELMKTDRVDSQIS